ncbi:hypothetical protein Bca52824_027529 [Brassica carinata]|uniref:UBC core domain-containing protein n=1 Tax=Brassica carinata TaxID=52824 RepID=A0A8X7VAM4_BRACI|nr:hypothetical protein Bca52824_027529 [Brassica carinata]
MVLPQAPDIVMVPVPPSRPFKLDGSGSSSRPVAAEVIFSCVVSRDYICESCESRMDLLRAVIIGPEELLTMTVFSFSIFSSLIAILQAPPKVHYHSGGLRINPILYNCGKVCLSLLGTWTGNSREKWLPKESTMLQLLVSIQELILNQKPYFNKPGYEMTMGTQVQSLQ